MKKVIRFRAPLDCAEQNGFEPRGEFMVIPLTVELDELSPAARWIAEHITATYVTDEYRDKMDIVAVAGFTCRDNDIRRGVSESKIAERTRDYGAIYTDEPMQDDITYPIMCERLNSPKAALEDEVAQLKKAGAVKLRCLNNGDEFIL